MRLFRWFLTASLLATPFIFAQDATTNPPNSSSTTQATDQKPAAPARATQRPKKVDYSKPVSHFPWIITPYMPRHVPEPVTVNTPRIDQVMQDGKIMLSLDDAIALALENNLDLAIARYNLDIADTDILRAKAGNSTRGVASGLVQGTPGGGVGGFGSGASGAGAGGTTSGTGGAGSGASGLVQSTVGTGSAISSYDPILTGTLSIEHASFPLSNTVTTGTNNLQQNTGIANFNYFQGFKTGTTMNVAFNNQRQITNSLFNLGARRGLRAGAAGTWAWRPGARPAPRPDRGSRCQPPPSRLECQTRSRRGDLFDGPARGDALLLVSVGSAPGRACWSRSLISSQPRSPSAFRRRAHPNEREAARAASRPSR